MLCTQTYNRKRVLHCRVNCVVYTDSEYGKRLILHTCTDSRVTTELLICAGKKKKKKRDSTMHVRL